MAKKNGGFFSGLFDFNGDGKTDIVEQFIAYKIFEDCTRDFDSNNDDSPYDDDPPDFDLDIDPDDPN